MKKLILTSIAIIVFTIANSQNGYPRQINNDYQPIEVLRKLKNTFNDTNYVLSVEKTIVYQNYKYYYATWQTGNVMNAELIKKVKLFSRLDYILGKRRSN